MWKWTICGLISWTMQKCLKLGWPLCHTHRGRANKGEKVDQNLPGTKLPPPAMDIRSGLQLGSHMTSAEERAYNGMWGLAPAGSRSRPLINGSCRGEARSGAKPPEAESILSFTCPIESEKSAFHAVLCATLYSRDPPPQKKKSTEEAWRDWFLDPPV